MVQIIELLCANYILTRSNCMFREAQQRMSQKYKSGSWRYYWHLGARIIKSIYHKEATSSKIDENNYVPYLPTGCKCFIFGKNNTVKIDPSVKSFVANITIGDPKNPICGCIVKVGKNTSCNGANIMLYEPNSSVYIGEGCMFSCGIEIWASDSHSIIDANSKSLLNWGTQIFIGNSVWIGMRSIILKNSHIANECIVEAGSIVAGAFKEEHCILAGNPAKVVKKGVLWDRLRPTRYREITEPKD